MKKIFGFDMDGTILNDKEQISDKLVSILIETKRLGHINVLVTGRPLIDIERVTNEYPVIFDYFVCNNGSYIIDVKTKEITKIGMLDFNVLKDIVKIASKYNVLYAFHTIEKIHRGKIFSNQPEWFESVMKEEWVRWIDEFDNLDDVMKEIEGKEIAQAAFRADVETANNLSKELKEQKWNMDTRIANGVYVDNNKKNVNKYNGLEIIVKKYDIDKNNVFVFGDSGNDIDMLENYPNSFAMGNATYNAKQVAKTVIGDNNSDAIFNVVNENK